MNLRRIYLILKSFIPTQLPTGRSAYEQFIKDIIVLVGPIADDTSIKWAIGNSIPHLGSDVDKVSMRYFCKLLRKAAANQVAGTITYELRQQFEAEKKAKEEAAKQLSEPKVEDTSLSNKDDVQKVLG